MYGALGMFEIIKKADAGYLLGLFVRSLFARRCELHVLIMTAGCQLLICHRYEAALIGV
jgi:hypothetical protein